MDFTLFVWGCLFGWMAADVFLYAAADASVSLSAALVPAGCHICQLLGATHSFQSPTIRAQLIDYLCYSPAVAHRKSATQALFTLFPADRHPAHFDQHLIVIVWIQLIGTPPSLPQHASISSCMRVLIPSTFQMSFLPKLLRNLQKSFDRAGLTRT